MTKHQTTYVGTARAVEDARQAVAGGVVACQRLIRNTLAVSQRSGVDYNKLIGLLDSVQGKARDVAHRYDDLAREARAIGPVRADQRRTLSTRLTTCVAELNEAQKKLTELFADYDRRLIDADLYTTLVHQINSVDSAATAIAALATYFQAHERPERN